MESTLTTPSDRDRSKKFTLTNAEPLTEHQTEQAMSALNQTAFVEKYPRVERRYADPEIMLQKIGLISFIPAKDAKPNKDGVYGFAKLRGNFATEEEASQKASFLIKNVDSVHQIYHTYVGRPFPLTESSDFSADIERIDIQKATAETISEDVKKKREKEAREIEEIKAKEKELLEEVKREEEPSDDKYTTLQVKRSQLSWTYIETKNKLSQMVTLIAKARKEIKDMEDKDPSLKSKYYDKYMNARKEAGLSIDQKSLQESFMKYLVQDAELPEVDQEYRNLFEQKND